MADTFEGARHQMVAEQLARRGIVDDAVLAAMRTVPRHRFVPADQVPHAYEDSPLPIGHGATISQPYIVALMAQALALRPSDRVLEVGTGSGYAAAVLAELVAHVTTIECVPALADQASERLRSSAGAISIVCADGSEGYPTNAPYDAISVPAAARVVPQPLVGQLAPGGRLVIPIGAGVEELTLMTRDAEGVTTHVLASVRFVPLTGRFGR